jgi:glutamate carboxypeptidase
MSVQSVQNYIERRMPFYLDMLRQMVAINSFTANPLGVNTLGEVTARLFADLGFATETVPSVTPHYGEHLLLTRPGRSPHKIALISHLDTVFPAEEEIRNQFAWREEGDRIYGPGTVDIKGGTVMIYIVLDALQEYFPELFNEINWHVMLDASEEALSDDFGRLTLQRLQNDALAYLVFEGGNTPDNQEFALVVARKGMVNYRLTTEGRASHAGAAHREGANAIVQMAQAVQHIAGLTDYKRELTFNVGTIGGGTVTNRVPHYAEAGVEMRAFSPAVFEEGVGQMMALNGRSDVRSGNGNFACRVNVEILRRTEPWPRNEPTDRLLALWQEASAPLGLRVIPEERGGLSDGNLTWQTIPTIDGLGPAGGNSHCSERSPDGSKEQEYVIVSSYVPKALLNVMAIKRLIEATQV